MATPLNIMVWNIRDMGKYVKGIEDLQKSCITVFFVNFIKSLSIDILVIQELKYGGVPMLCKIVELLNEGVAEGEEYRADFVSSRSKANCGLRGDDQTQAALSMISSECTEAYGLIGKAKWIQRQEVEHPLSPYRAIELCWKSFCSVVVNEKVGPSFIQNPKEDPPVPKPLNFVSTGIFRTETIAEVKVKIRKDKPGDMSLKEAEDAVTLCTNPVTRRPCKVNLMVNGKSITLLTYHGMSKREDPTNEKACYGASLATLLNEINDITIPNVILAGDFNIVESASITSAFSGETFNSFYNPQTLSSKPKTEEKTYFGTDVNVNQGTYTNPTPLDLMFTSFTEGGGVTIPKTCKNAVLDVPTLLGTNSGPVYSLGKNMITSSQWKKLVAEVFKEVTAENANFNSFSQKIKNAGINQTTKLPFADDLKNIFSRGNPFNVLTAALFYDMFISDHLPLMISLEVNDEL